MSDGEEHKGILMWFASDHVAANFLMLLVVVTGLLSIFTAKMHAIVITLFLVPSLYIVLEDLKIGLFKASQVLQDLWDVSP